MLVIHADEHIHIIIIYHNLCFLLLRLFVSEVEYWSGAVRFVCIFKFGVCSWIYKLAVFSFSKTLSLQERVKALSEHYTEEGATWLIFIFFANSRNSIDYCYFVLSSFNLYAADEFLLPTLDLLFVCLNNLLCALDGSWKYIISVCLIFYVFVVSMLNVACLWSWDITPMVLW